MVRDEICKKLKIAVDATIDDRKKNGYDVSDLSEILMSYLHIIAGQVIYDQGSYSVDDIIDSIKHISTINGAPAIDGAKGDVYERAQELWREDTRRVMLESLEMDPANKGICLGDYGEPGNNQ